MKTQQLPTSRRQHREEAEHGQENEHVVDLFPIISLAFGG
jgi:hypothetical protein